MTKATYRIANWNQYQHYKHRSPPWIKLHYELLTSEMWVSLDDASRVLAIACMLLASRHDGEIPANDAYVKRAAYLNSKPNWDKLVSVGFLELTEHASTTLADDSKVHTNATPEKRREEQEKSDSKKHPHGEFKNVLLTADEYAKLIAEHGEQKAKLGITVLDDYIESNGKKYKSHYAVLKPSGWVWNRVQKEGNSAVNGRTSLTSTLDEQLAREMY